MKKGNIDYKYVHEDLFPDPDELITDNHILDIYFKTRKTFKDKKAVIEVWECFKEYLVKQLLDNKIRRLKIGNFATLQTKITGKVDKRKFLMDKAYTMYFLDTFLGKIPEIDKFEKYYLDTYGGLTKQEIDDKASNINNLLKIKRRRQQRKNNK